MVDNINSVTFKLNYKVLDFFIFNNNFNLNIKFILIFTRYLTLLNHNSKLIKKEDLEIIYS
jgi:hypothetical protein